MSRAVDVLLAPAEGRSMKVIGLGPSRTGTLGLWQALKTLGYTPFHISELLPYGFQQMRALQEAIIANDSDNPFQRAEFDKLFAGYDCIVESPCYLCPNIIKEYLEDPDVKFILTERTPESWAKSIAGSLGAYHAKLAKPPLSIARYFDSFIWELTALFKAMTHRWSGGLEPSDPGFNEALSKSYVEYLESVKALVPADKLLVLNLEKGFGWEEICIFLGKDVPEEPYPLINAMSDFHVAAEMVVSPAIKKTMRILTSSAVAIAGVGIWYWQRRR
ncbi:hypothetical protein BDP81DRAFT_487614 [Colletotrichum phormii]|uniref:NAD dependent epimerase/dehydratase n=1 Tax=Colletotrichum phormii TaxID=359342 RepID=A0AAJ0A494_9PEZI|nr:uncharacterized protein BDP81DRAFT_487614 [Colletotrichum phormii]KAK1656211.1 hypothetical protein BDP81DRAFT_487614 [Colletotrichum phormii]